MFLSLLKQQVLEVEAPGIIFRGVNAKAEEGVPEGIHHIPVEHSVAELVLKRLVNDHLEGVGIVVDNVKLHVVTPLALKGPAKGNSFDRLECSCECEIPLGVGAVGDVPDTLVEREDVVHRGLAEDERAIRDGGNVVENHGVDTDSGLYDVTMSLLKYSFRC